jgi:hypothetical protein
MTTSFMEEYMAPRDTAIDAESRISSESGLSHITERVVLPLPPAMAGDTRFEMEIYARFMRHLRQVPNSRMEIKILSAIQFTADMLDLSDALVAKVLSDLGLRAPRKAYPISFLDFIDKALQRRVWDSAPPPVCVPALRSHWDRIGEDRLTGIIPGYHGMESEHSHCAVI